MLCPPTGVTYRNPVLLAKAAVTIDHLSGGRMELGIGAAWHDVEHQQYGFDFPSVGTRMDMLDEASAIIKMAFRRERSSFQGKHFQLDNAIFLPKPVNGNIPLWIGGGGEKRTLRSVAQYADGWNYFMTDPEEYRHKLSVLHQHCQDAQRDSKEIRQGLIVRAVLDQDAEAPDAPTIVCSSETLIEKLKAYRDLGVQDSALVTPTRRPENARSVHWQSGPGLASVDSLSIRCGRRSRESETILEGSNDPGDKENVTAKPP